MKLKIRGLVFTGFAAAVFAQSAWALPPAESLTEDQIDALKATVTSKFYVDSNYQDLVERKGTEGTAPNDTTTITSNSTNDQYPTSRNVYKFVKSEIAELDDIANIHGDGTYVEVADDANQNKQVQLAQAPATTGANIATDTLTTTTTANGETTLGTADRLVTAGAVKSLIDTSITSADSTNNSQMPTSKAVYDFMNSESDGFQRKITSDEASALANFNSASDAGEGVMIGYRGTGEDSGWNIFGAKPNAVYQGDDASSNHLSYLEIERNTTSASRGAYLVGIKRGALAENAGAISAANSSDSTAYATRDKLTTAYAVYQYAVPNQWDSSTQANKTLVTDANGVVTVSNVPALPEITNNNPCRTEGVHCALVSSADASGNVSFSWNVMAGAEGTSNSGGGNQSGGNQSGGSEQGGGTGGEQGGGE